MSMELSLTWSYRQILVTAGPVRRRRLRIGDRDCGMATAVIFTIQARGTALLAFSNADDIWLGCVLFGLGVGNLSLLRALILQREFSPVESGRAFAMAMAINQFIFAFAPSTFGMIRDTSSSYTIAFSITLVAYLCAALLIVNVVRPRPVPG